jgi:uncharacterized protein DUF2695
MPFVARATNGDDWIVVLDQAAQLAIIDGMSNGHELSRRRDAPERNWIIERERMPMAVGLDGPHLKALLAYLDRALSIEPCDHTLRHSIAWAHEQGLDEKRFIEGLEAYGGFCDDEVILNLDPDRFR